MLLHSYSALVKSAASAASEDEEKDKKSKVKKAVKEPVKKSSDHISKILTALALAGIGGYAAYKFWPTLKAGRSLPKPKVKNPWAPDASKPTVQEGVAAPAADSNKASIAQRAAETAKTTVDTALAVAPVAMGAHYLSAKLTPAVTIALHKLGLAGAGTIAAVPAAGAGLMRALIHATGKLPKRQRDNYTPKNAYIDSDGKVENPANGSSKYWPTGDTNMTTPLGF